MEEQLEEAHYWFCLQDVADLSLHVGLDKVLTDLLELRMKRTQNNPYVSKLDDDPEEVLI
jgi:Golgi nucleoside diphosphatase